MYIKDYSLLGRGMKTYKFKLYENRRNRYLKRSINASASIYNHCIALHKRYYRMFEKHLNKFRLMQHIAKLRRKNSYWKLVGSQAVQNICDRIQNAYALFFKHSKQGVRPPSFRSAKKYKSFTLKQAGYKFLGANRVRIGKITYKFHLSREIKGKIKTVTIKRSSIGEMYLIVVTNLRCEYCGIVTGKAAGFDFGLKCFLTDSMGVEYKSPQFLLKASKQIKAASRRLSSKKKGSRNWHKARVELARLHERIVNQRRDWFWKLAHQLCQTYDHLFFEDLNLRGMVKLWGRKVHDLAFASFLEILQCVANKTSKYLGFVSRWYPSSKRCNHCGAINQDLKLEDRRWRCNSCFQVVDRDRNAAKNLCGEGLSSVGLGDVRQGLASAIAVRSQNPRPSANRRARSTSKSCIYIN